MAKESPSGWGKVFSDSEMEIAYRMEIVSVTASGWGLGRSQEEIEREARRRLKENRDMDYPAPRRSSSF